MPKVQIINTFVDNYEKIHALQAEHGIDHITLL